MLANERLITKMSLEQKVKLVTSAKAYENSPVDNYEFPVFKIKGQPYEDCSEVCATAFPSDRALASTWNTKLIGNVYRAIGAETKKVHSFGYFNSTDDYSLENLSSDVFVTAKFILAKTFGLSRSGQPVNFELTSGNGGAISDREFIAETVLSGAKPTSILLDNSDKIEDITKKFKYENLFYGKASSVEDTVRLILAGCSLVFISEDFTDGIINFLTERTEAYRRDYKLYHEGSMALGEFDSRVRNLEIFDEQILDEACDKLISLLYAIKEGGEPAEMKGLGGKDNAKFDEVTHDALALKAARESVVLLKNDGVLPLTHHTKLAVIGEYAKDLSYQKELFGYDPTVEMLPFEAINDYDWIVTSGYVSGYKKGETGRADLLDAAVELSKKSDCALLYLCAGKGQTSLPPEQIELIDELHSNGVSIIAVVACDQNIDLSFEQKCNAVVYAQNAGQEGTAAVLDILCGIVTPSGKLAANIVGPYGEVIHPLGHGLSYTQFDYTNFNVNEEGVSFTITNVGTLDGHASVQLYVKKEGGEGLFAKKTLRGFAKKFVKSGESINVEIPFDENTFKSYSSSKNCYIIEGGEYIISIAEDYNSDKLAGMVTLCSHQYKDIFENEVVQSTEGEELEFTGDKEKNERIRAKKKISYSVKIFIAVMLGVYYNALIAVFAFTPVISEKSLMLYIILGAVAAVFDIALLIYIIITALQRKKQKYLPEDVVLTDMVGRISEFKEIAKVTYDIPVEEDEETVEAQESETEAAEEQETTPENPYVEEETEEVEERKFDMEQNESEETITFAEHMSLAEMCANFREFAQNFGVNIEITSVRAFIGALAASKIVILKSANTELMPAMLDAICAYFGNTTVTEAGSDWKKTGDIMWVWNVDSEKYEVSQFTNAVFSAGRLSAKMCVAVLNNVSAENVGGYFATFIDYANHPSEEHELKVSADYTIKLPDNITYLLVPEDGTAVFPKELINASTVVELAISKVENTSETEAKCVARAEFDDLVKVAREEAFLPEKTWKKLDELVETINATEKFEVGNKNTLQTEKITSVIMECGGDESEAFTQLFIGKLVPLLKTTRLYKQDDGDRTISGIIEKLFPDEELTKIQRALAKLN